MAGAKPTRIAAAWARRHTISEAEKRPERPLERLTHPQKCPQFPLIMVSRKKIHLAKVLTSPNVPCPECGYSIPPSEVVRLGMDRMRCPKCNREFSGGEGDIFL